MITINVVRRDAYDVILNSDGSLNACMKADNSITVDFDTYKALHNGTCLVNGKLFSPVVLTPEQKILAEWNASQKTTLDKLKASQGLFALQNINGDVYIMARIKMDDDNDPTLMNQLRAVRAQIDQKLGLA